MIGSRRIFSCDVNRGLFVPLEEVEKIDCSEQESESKAGKLKNIRFMNTKRGNRV